MSQGPLMRLDDDIWIENIIPRLDDDANLALTCKRLCALVRLAVTKLELCEDDCLILASLPVSCTYARCRGVCYYAQGTDDPSLPGLSALLCHLLCWHNLSEVALVVQKPSDADPAVRQANHVVLKKLHHLSAINSLRHLQLYKTAPFVADAPQLAHLTQLTSLVLADSSYIPGPEAMLQVDLSPLSTLIHLKSLAVSGICPVTGCNSTDATDDTGMASATAGTGVLGISAGCLPTSLTSLVLKSYDEMGLQSWLQHILCLNSLRLLHVWNYQEPMGNMAYQAFPAPLLELLADRLPCLQDITMMMDDRGERGRRCPTGHSSLPSNLSKLQQLSSLTLGWCQLTINNAEQWDVLAGLTQLTNLGAIHACCAPAMPYELSGLQVLSLSTAELWAVGKGINLQHSFPQLSQIHVQADSARQWLSIAPNIAQCHGLMCVVLRFGFVANKECINALHELGSSLSRLVTLRLVWGGGPARWSLPDFSTFNKLKHLQLILPPTSHSAAGTYAAQSIGDAQVLAYLAPVTNLTDLVMRGFVCITPALILGLQALMPQLQCCVLVRCSPEILALDAYADWQGNDMQLVRAALRKDLHVDIFATYKQYVRCRCYELPCSIEFVDAHQHCF